MTPRNGLAGLIARTENAAEQHITIALHAAGARIAVGRVVDGHRFHAVEHDGRRIAVVLTRDADRDAALDRAGWAVYVVSAALCELAPQRAVGDVLAAVRERGKRDPDREAECTIGAPERPRVELEVVDLAGRPANETEVA